MKILSHTEPSNGTLIGFDSDAGTFIYQPDTGFVGTDTFTYFATNDYFSTALATVTFTVLDADPPIGVPNEYTINEDETLLITATPDGLLVNDSDPQGLLPLTAEKVLDADKGTATLDQDKLGGFTYVPELNDVGDRVFYGCLPYLSLRPAQINPNRSFRCC